MMMGMSLTMIAFLRPAKKTRREKVFTTKMFLVCSKSNEKTKRLWNSQNKWTNTTILYSLNNTIDVFILLKNLKA